ncbi:hypothetical protein [Kitasatospora sp. NPDC088134]|uniref:hypothetical protein n=1 Tax=Kitasatospora sp. NPDC088134 TaxID=3364071 RepID=UPI0038289C24
MGAGGALPALAAPPATARPTAARRLAALSAEGPADHHRRTHRTIGHECAEIGTAPRTFPTTRGPFPPGLLHVQYSPAWTE